MVPRASIRAPVRTEIVLALRDLDARPAAVHLRDSHVAVVNVRIGTDVLVVDEVHRGLALHALGTGPALEEPGL